MRSKQNTLRPIDARTFDQICGLPRDNIESGGYRICVDAEEVAIRHQRREQPVSEQIVIPRRAFNKIVKWYLGAGVDNF
jgi:hypothetical protein